MKPARSAKNWTGRTLSAIGFVCLFAVAMVAFPALHHHDHLAGNAADHCVVCIAHATSASAVVADAHVPVAVLNLLSTSFVVPLDVVVLHAPLTADSRGPPVLL